MSDLSAIEEFVQSELLEVKLAEVASSLAERTLRKANLSAGPKEALKRFIVDSSSQKPDPEVFPPLFALTERTLTSAESEAIAQALLVHAGLEPISTFGLARPRFLRLAHSSGKVLLSQGEQWYDVTRMVLEPFAGLYIYWPYPSLFEDILPDEHYPTTAHLEISRERAIETLIQALEFVRQFSPALSQVLLASVKNIVVLPSRNSVRHSFSCRTAYLGSIFIDLNRSAETVAEDLIHETVHQSLWPHWSQKGIEVCHHQQVFSPVTKRWKPADVMTHAYIVYRLAIAFHRLVLIDDTQRHRIELLSEALPVLRQQLPLDGSEEIKRLITRADALLDASQIGAIVK